MTDRPILFSAPMIRALLDGRKTQTRRVLKPQPDQRCFAFKRVFADPPHFEARDRDGLPVNAFPAGKGSVHPYPPIRFAVGDRLWVKESYCFGWDYDDNDQPIGDGRLFYAADNDVGRWFDSEKDEWRDSPPWRSSRFMPRAASRVTLVVTRVRVERVQDISEADARAEGVERDCGDGCCWKGADRSTVFSEADAYHSLWDSLNAKRGFGWDANPWVVAISFDVHRENIDRVAS